MESNQMQIFTNEEFSQVRTVLIDDAVWFVGKDVADNLGYKNGSRDVTRHVDAEDRRKLKLFDGRQNKETIVINESGLYSLILFSKLPNAKKFKRWVTSEIIPSAIKTGAYALDGSFEKHVLDLIQKNNENFSMLMESQNKIVQGLVSMNERINNLEQHTVASPTLAQTVAPAATTIPVNQSAALPSSEPSISKQEFIDTVTSKFVQKPCIKGMIFFLTGHNPKTISVRDQSVSIAFNYMYSQLVTVFGLNWKDRAPAQTKVDRLTPEDFVHCVEICYDAMLKKNLDPIEFINLMSA